MIVHVYKIIIDLSPHKKKKKIDDKDPQNVISRPGMNNYVYMCDIYMHVCREMMEGET